MNWFERYGVVGGYFLFVLMMWLNAISDITINFGDAEKILGLASILPFGYLISIFSQYLYYTGFYGRTIHNEIGEIIRNSKEFQKHIELREAFSEEENETIITCWVRMKLFNSKLESFRFLANFATKRFDVISINNSLIIATIMAPLTVVLGNIFLKEMQFRYNGMLWIISILSVSILVIVIISNGKLSNQILLLNKEIFNSRNFSTDFEQRRMNLIQKVRENFLNKKIPGPLAYLIIFIFYLVFVYTFTSYVSLVNQLIKT